MCPRLCCRIIGCKRNDWLHGRVNLLQGAPNPLFLKLSVLYAQHPCTGMAIVIVIFICCFLSVLLTGLSWPANLGKGDLVTLHRSGFSNILVII